MNTQKRLGCNFFLGTWQLSGQFGAVSTSAAINFIKECQSLGVKHFDTAICYGDGSVESILGSSLEKDAFIVTKIPSIDKRYPLEKAYPDDHVRRSIDESCQRLKRVPDVFLFHYWNSEWPTKRTLELIDRTVTLGSIKAIGISVPNGYTAPLAPDVLAAIRYIEIPCNKEEPWVTTTYLSNLKKSGQTVLLRSLFRQGLLTRNTTSLAQLLPSDYRYIAKDKYLLNKPVSPEEEIRRTLHNHRCSLVIGASNIEQVKTNFHSFQKCEIK